MAVAVVCRAAEVVRQQGWSWAALARRTGLPVAVLRRLRVADANPPLLVAERIARALDVSIETLWSLRR